MFIVIHFCDFRENELSLNSCTDMPSLMTNIFRLSKTKWSVEFQKNIFERIILNIDVYKFTFEN